MSTEGQIPDWVADLAEAVAGAVEFKGQAGMEWRACRPDDTAWGVDLLEMAPALMEIAQAGPHDGEQVHGIIHSLNLLAVQEAFDEVVDLSFGLDNEGRPELTVEGRIGDREIVLLIHTYPFEDAEPGDVIELG